MKQLRAVFVLFCGLAVATLSTTAAAKSTQSVTTKPVVPPKCAKNGQVIPKRMNRYNTVLVHTLYYGKDGQLITDQNYFPMIRLGQSGMHIPIDTPAISNCYVLTKLPYFGKRPPQVCARPRHHYVAMADPEHPNRSAACPIMMRGRQFWEVTLRYQDAM
jgi:hypothetical protein